LDVPSVLLVAWRRTLIARGVEPADHRGTGRQQNGAPPKELRLPWGSAARPRNNQGVTDPDGQIADLPTPISNSTRPGVARSETETLLQSGQLVLHRGRQRVADLVEPHP